MMELMGVLLVLLQGNSLLLFLLLMAHAPTAMRLAQSAQEHFTLNVQSAMVELML
jgi:hypothetical protein